MIKKLRHVCEICDSVVKSYTLKNGKDSYVYPKICKICSDDTKKLKSIKREVDKKLEEENKFKNIPTEFIENGSYLKTIGKEDKRILSKQFKAIRLLPIPKFCKFCTAELNSNNVIRSLFDKGYCSEWCEEMENPLELTKFCSCGNALSTYKYKSGKRKGQSNGIYPVWCEECILVGKHSRLLKVAN